MDNKFYVYAHYKKTNGSLFYIGKGKGSRSKSKSGRSKHWRNIVKKHGYFVGYLGFFDDEMECYDFESDQILKARMVCNICNIANGGNGGLSGIPLKKDHIEKLRKAKIGKKQMPSHALKSALAKKGKKQPKEAVEYVSGLKRKKVINSDGDIFKSASEAARLISEKHNINASQGNISMACRGERDKAYGRAWSYDLSEVPKIKKRLLCCSNGMKFKSLSDASKWVSSWRNKCAPSGITNAISKNSKAYGFYWFYKESYENTTMVA